MTTEQLRYFVSIAENGSYSLTAEAMNISQSVVSKQIRTFEWELGCILFDRSHRRVRLTEIGAKLYPMLKSLLEQFDTIMREAHGYKTNQNSIKLISLPIMGQYGITEALRLFEIERKDIQVEIVEQEEHDLLESLTNGEYDVAITREEMLPAHTYKVQKLTRDRLALFVNERHPYAKYQYVTPEMLANETFMFMLKHTHIYQLCMRFCKKHGIMPNVVSYARIETILSNVESARCSALLMAKTVNIFHLTRTKVIPVKPACISNIVAVCDEKEEPKTNVQDFMTFLANYFAH